MIGRIVLFASVSLGCIGLSSIQPTPPPRLHPEDIAVFEWFSRVADTTSRDLAPIEVWTGGMWLIGGSTTGRPTTAPGFLIRASDGRFDVLSPTLLRTHYVARPSARGLGPVRYENRSFGWMLALCAASPARLAFDEGQSGPMPRPPVADFLLAWHCWNQRRTKDAARLLDRIRPPSGATSAPGKPLRDFVADQVGRHLFQLLVADFGVPHAPRSRLLLRLRKFAVDLPAAPDARRATILADNLESLVREEEAHPLIDDDALARLSPPAQAAELVRRLHRAEEVRIYREKAPDTALVALGDAAIPALIAALDDPRPTTLVSFRRWDRGGSAQEGHLVTVGQRAREILTAISGKAFNRTPLSVYTPVPTEPSAFRREVESWWAEYRR